MTQIQVAVDDFAPEDIGSRAPPKVLSVIFLELSVDTDDDFVGETVALGYQYALRAEFARQCPELSLLYDLETKIIGRREGSKVYDIKVAPVLKKKLRHLERDIQLLEESVLVLSAEASAAKAAAEKKTLMARILAVVAGLTTALNLGIAAHTFGEKWGLIPEKARQAIEQNHPGTMIRVRQTAFFEVPSETDTSPGPTVGPGGFDFDA